MDPKYHCSVTYVIQNQLIQMTVRNTGHRTRSCFNQTIITAFILEEVIKEINKK